MNIVLNNQFSPFSLGLLRSLHGPSPEFPKLIYCLSPTKLGGWVRVGAEGHRRELFSYPLKTVSKAVGPSFGYEGLKVALA